MDRNWQVPTLDKLNNVTKSCMFKPLATRTRITFEEVMVKFSNQTAEYIVGSTGVFTEWTE